MNNRLKLQKIFLYKMKAAFTNRGMQADIVQRATDS